MANENYIVINGKRAELTEEQLKQLGIEVKKASPFERAEEGKEYFFITSFGGLQNPPERMDAIDDGRFDTANYCTDRDLLYQRSLHETLDRLLWRYSMEHDGDKIDWDNHSVDKWAISYDCSSEEYTAIWSVCNKRNCTYFYTNEIAQNAINEIVKPFIEAHPDFVW